jgi:hypothetical protein
MSVGGWPALETDTTVVRHGICGDPAGSPQVYAQPGPVVATYAAGGVVQATVKLTAHHRGHMELRLCTSASALTQSCLNANKLVRAVTAADPYPIDPAHPGTCRCKACAQIGVSIVTASLAVQNDGTFHHRRTQVSTPHGFSCQRECILRSW